MAAIAAAAVTMIAFEGSAEVVWLGRVNNVTSGDTFDAATLCTPIVFKKIKQAPFVPAGDLATTAAASISGTGLTLTLASLAADSVYLMIVGSR